MKGFGGSYLGCIEHLDHVVVRRGQRHRADAGAPVRRTDTTTGATCRSCGVRCTAATRRTRRVPPRSWPSSSPRRTTAGCTCGSTWSSTTPARTNPHSAGAACAAWTPTSTAGTRTARPRTTAAAATTSIPAHPWVRELVLEALDRYADLGVDGFRFDLASLLTRDGGGLVEPHHRVGARPRRHAHRRAVGHGRLSARARVAVADAGCSGTTASATRCAGSCAASRAWCARVRQRVQGSPDLFGPDGAVRSLNFVTAHDGLTLHDLTIRHRRSPPLVGLRPGTAPAATAELLHRAAAVRRHADVGDGRRVRPHASRGTTTRTTSTARSPGSTGSRADEWAELTDFVRALIALRRRHPLAQFRFHGVGPAARPSAGTRTASPGAVGDLYVMANAWWEPLTFEVQEPGEWHLALATVAPERDGEAWTVHPRSVVVLERRVEN